jgi:hypothetical protein
MPLSEARFLPDPRRRGEIQFVFAKSLPYNRRLAIVLGLLVAGFILQIVVGLGFGAPLLLVASLLAVVKGFSNVPEELGHAAEWRGAGREQLEQILRIAERSRRWDQSFVDITCGVGFLGLVLAGMAVAGLALVLMAAGQEWLAMACVLDSLVLLLPHWITGVRRILTNDPLTIKVKLLLTIIRSWESVRREGETIHPQMQVLHTPKGEMPNDAKLLLRFEKLGDEFLGLQVQVTANRVQGSDYPYLYCVLVARPGLRMRERLKATPPSNIVAEPDRKPAENIDILVIRQRTTKTSGYHTDSAACQAIFLYALGLCRKLEQAAKA